MDKYIPKTFKNRDILDADDINKIENALVVEDGYKIEIQESE